MEVEVTDPIEELLTSYSDLNQQRVEEYHQEPSALEFMRFVAKNLPLVVRGGVKDWPATKKWNTAYLKAALKGESINVAVTPSGNADSPLLREDGTLVFIKPWEEDQLFSDFIDHISTQELTGDKDGEVRYAQTQNDNLRGEYETLLSDVEKNIPWARIALEKEPDAINLWIGNSRSVTALHHDPYENIYCQIRGQKHFVLLPPLAYSCINEQLLQPAHYIRSGDSLTGQLEAASSIPFATWDPDVPSRRATEYSSLAVPLRLTLEEGDLLYLPALWFHKVSQSCDEEGLCVAINYWHDIEYSGSFHPMTTFIRNVGMKKA